MKKHLYQLLLIVFMMFLVWYKILFQTPKGEGFMFFEPQARFLSFISFDTGSRLIFNFFILVFKDNLQIFQLFILFFIILLALFFYWFSYEATCNKTISFISSLIFGVNYTATYEMMGSGNPTRFTNRALWFLLLFPAFIFFLKYLRLKKEKHYLISLLFYTIAVYLAQFSIFFLPIFLSYIIAILFNEKKSFRKNFKIILRVFPYIIITFIILILDNHYDKISFVKSEVFNRSFFSFLIEHQKLIFNQFLHQLSILMFPEQVVLYVSSKWIIPLRDAFFVFRTLSLPFYIAFATFLLKKENKLRTLIIALLLFIPSVSILNSYVRSEMIEVSSWGDRYLYVPMVAMSILWGISIHLLIRSKKTIIKIISYILILMFVYTNTKTLWKLMDQDYFTYKEIKTTLSYIKNLSPKISEDSIVIVPSTLGYHGAVFAKVFYNKNQGIFMPIKASWHKKLEVQTNPGDYIIRYDPAKRPFDPRKDYILEYDKQTDRIVDLTKNYKEILLQKKQEEP